jgi:hypothetical protein
MAGRPSRGRGQASRGERYAVDDPGGRDHSIRGIARKLEGLGGPVGLPQRQSEKGEADGRWRAFGGKGLGRATAAVQSSAEMSWAGTKSTRRKVAGPLSPGLVTCIEPRQNEGGAG